MEIEKLKLVIESAYNSNSFDDGTAAMIEEAISLLDQGVIRICDKDNGAWKTNDWVRQAILLYFRITPASIMSCGYYDKIPLKFHTWNEADFIKHKIRVVPGAIVRYGSFIDQGCIIMTSFINIGAFIGKNTMIDINATLGSCCHVGANCHIGANSVIGGVLEPLEETPVILCDNVFIGAGSTLTNGVVVDDGAAIAPGAHISKSTRIYDCTTGEISYGYIPKDAVVVPGTITRNLDTTNSSESNIGVHIASALIVKYADAQTKSKVGINNLLRT